MATPLLAAGAGLLALPMVAVAVFFGSGAADPPPTGTVCTVLTRPGVTDPAAGQPTDTGTTQLSGDQVQNARVIVAATKALGMGQQAGVVAVMTAYQESKLLVLANPAVPESLNYPHQGLGHDHDSVGTFQQRTSAGWGTVAQLMDPGYAATKFLTTLAEVPGWQSLPLWQAAQQVQVSADGTLYAQWEPLATAITTALWDGTTGTLQCTAAGGPLTGPGGTFPPEACSVVPDPSTGRGCLTPRMLNIYAQLVAQGWHPGCYRPGDPVPGSDHPQGKACDAPPGAYGVLPTAEQKARGDALAASLIVSAAQTGVHYLIWYGQIWNADRASEGWRPYNGAGVYDPANVTGGHYDHVHISVY